MLYSGQHFGDILHGELRGYLKSDTTTLGQIKHMYKIYNESGLSRRLLESQINIICYDKKWKND